MAKDKKMTQVPVSHSGPKSPFIADKPDRTGYSVVERLRGTLRPCKDCDGVWVTIDGQTQHCKVIEVNGYASLIFDDSECLPF